MADLTSVKTNKKINPSYPLLPLIFFSLLSSFSFASPSPSPSTTPSPSLKNLFEQKGAHTETLQLNKAYHAYIKGHFITSKKILSHLLQHPQLADHALYLNSLCQQAQSQKALQEKKWKSAIEFAQGAIRDLNRIQTEFPYSSWQTHLKKHIGELLLEKGIALSQQKKWTLSQIEFEKGFKWLSSSQATYLISSKAVEAYALSCQKKERPLCHSWALTLNKILSKNTLEGKTLAQFFQKNISLSPPNYNSLKNNSSYPQKGEDEIAFSEAFQQINQNEWGEAISLLNQFLERFPQSILRHKTRYWLAQCVEKKNGKSESTFNKKLKPLYEQIIKESPLSFYGVLSTWKLKQDIQDRLSSTPPLLTDQDPFQEPDELYRLDRAKELYRAGAYFFSAQELSSLSLRSSAPSSYLFYLAKLSSLSGNYLSSFQALSELIARNEEGVYSRFSIEMIFPIVEWELIQKIALEVDIDPVLVLSLMKQESAFSREIHSRSGASGYMQLMPFTASEIESTVKRKDLLSAETNIRIGSKYLKKMILQFNGNVAYALAAYNAGPNAVKRWLKNTTENKDLPSFIEQIPYAETQNYVGSIFRNYVWYKKRLENATVNTTDVFWPSSP